MNILAQAQTIGAQNMQNLAGQPGGIQQLAAVAQNIPVLAGQAGRIQQLADDAEKMQNHVAGQLDGSSGTEPFADHRQVLRPRGPGTIQLLDAAKKPRSGVPLFATMHPLCTHETKLRKPDEFVPDGQPGPQGHGGFFLPYPMDMGDGKKELHEFDPVYHLADTCTAESVAPHMEYMGVKEEAEDIESKCQKVMQKVWAPINKLKKTPEGLLEILKDFDKYTGQLSTAYETVGFMGRDVQFASFALMNSLMKQKFPTEFGEIVNNQAMAGVLCETLLTVEPWDTKVQSMRDSTLVLSPSTTQAMISSFTTSVSNGDHDSPSFHFQLTGPMNPGVAERLSKWFKDGGDEFDLNELKILIPSDTSMDAGQVSAFIESIGSCIAGAACELLTLSGTRNIAGEDFAETKLATKFLTKFLAGTQQQTAIERLNIENCVVDFDTFMTLPGVIAASTITSLRMANLVLGLNPGRSEPFDTVKMGADIGHAWSICDCCNVGCCLGGNQPDSKAMSEDFEKMVIPRISVDRFVAKQTAAMEALVKAIGMMSSRGHVDVIDFSGTNLPHICGTIESVAALLTVICQQKPSAIKLLDTGLTGVHVPSVCKVFFLSPKLLHFDVTLTLDKSGGLTCMSAMQSLVKNSPMLLSCNVVLGQVQTFQVASLPHRDIVEESCCCASWNNVQWKQEMKTFTFPKEGVMEDDDFKQYAGPMKTSLADNTVLPLHMALKTVWKGETKKLRRLVRVSRDEFYKGVLSEEADAMKISTFKKMIQDSGSMAADLESMFLDDRPTPNFSGAVAALAAAPAAAPAAPAMLALVV